MRRLPAILLVLLGVSCTFPLPGVLPAPKPKALVGLGDPGSLGLSVVVDGEAEGLWRGQPTLSVDRLVLGTVSSAADLSASYRVLYDKKGLSFFAVVKDDVKVAPGQGGVWSGDGVELYLDLGPDAPPGAYGSSTFRYFFGWGSPVPLEAQGRVEGVTCATANLSDGYQIESQIPWSTLGRTPASGENLGFEVMVVDDDGHGAEGKLAWYGHDDTAQSDPRKFGAAHLSEGLLFNATNSPPAIDGTADPVWDQQSLFPLKWNLIGSTKHGADLTASFSAVWDASYFYVLLDVRDDDRQPNPDNQSDLDGVELFLDGTHSRTEVYGPGDVHIIIGHGANGGMFVKGSGAGSHFAQVNYPAPGYRIEGRIPWSTLRTTPAEGSLMGLEVWTNDSDAVDAGLGGSQDGGPSRLERIGLFADSGIAQDTPAGFGNAELHGSP